MNIRKIIAAFALLSMGIGLAPADEYATQFSNRGSIGNTRHNMTQRQASGGGPNGLFMKNVRNDYGEVCVYCHTPHGANTKTTLPLWNRTMKATTYATYNQLGTSSLTQTVVQPGANSLACLSCHDGQTAIDSIINMPGSDRYKKSQEDAATQDTAFLTSWGTANVGTSSTVHQTLSSTGCLACHAAGPGFPGATDFSFFAIGTDLTNDHPVGVTYPSANGPGTDFNKPGGTKGSASFFDDGDGSMDSGDVRLYDAKVECASCHDPHGVPTGGPNSVFKPSFLRVDNTGSKICLTCHAK